MCIIAHIQDCLRGWHQCVETKEFFCRCDPFEPLFPFLGWVGSWEPLCFKHKFLQFFCFFRTPSRCSNTQFGISVTSLNNGNQR